MSFCPSFVRGFFMGERNVENLGFEEGDICGREGCDGVIELSEAEDCRCHISAPCHYCTSIDYWCPECGWEACDEDASNNSTEPKLPIPNYFQPLTQRVLDNTKIDFFRNPHSSCSMIKEGVYPKGTTMQEVEKEVSGTFGGRFESFGDGRFKYIAYTD